MTEQKPQRSGLIAFGIFTVLLLGAIGATVLLANNFRNLNLLLTHFGYAPMEVLSKKRIPRSYELKGNRLPRPKATVSVKLLMPGTSNQFQFFHISYEDPEVLCGELRRTGFVNSSWKEGAFDKDSWECQSYREFTGEREGADATSSAFVSIRGNGETRVASLRVKLNLEKVATKDVVTDAAVSAIGAFLGDIPWGYAAEIFSNIRELREFDVIRFGHRILLKKELSATPRYNIIITPDRRRNRGSYLPDYFNRALWLPLPKKISRRLDTAITTAHTSPK